MRQENENSHRAAHEDTSHHVTPGKIPLIRLLVAQNGGRSIIDIASKTIFREDLLKLYRRDVQQNKDSDFYRGIYSFYTRSIVSRRGVSKTTSRSV